MIDLSVAAVVAAITIPAAALIITVIKTRGTTADNASDNRTARSLDHGDGCPLHPALSALLKETRDDVRDTRNDVKEIRENITEILMQVREK